MKKGMIFCLLVLCSSMLIACGKQADSVDSYTKDAQVDEQKQTGIVEDIDKNEAEKKDQTSVEKEVVESTPQADEGQTQAQTSNSEGTTSSSMTTPPPVVNEKPVENARISKVTISIDTKTLLNNMDKVAENKKAYVPSDGWILAPITVDIQEGDTVFDVLSKVTRERRIHMEYQGANQNIYNSVYIQGIGQLYEFDGGDLSGWMYTINGAYVSKGASGVKVEDGMKIEWRYTCDLGRDLGL